MIHGLYRTSKSMKDMAKAMTNHGYVAVTLNYQSRKYSIEQLSSRVIPAGVSACRARGANRIHIITHSMGGILARHYLESNTISGFGRLVMLGPPNQGSELIDFYQRMPGFSTIMGPAAQQLGTDDNSMPRKLGPINVDTAIIAGTVSSNSLMSLSLPGLDDGKVTAATTRVDGMCAQVLMPVSHRLIMKDAATIAEVLNYISTGKFTSKNTEYFSCAQ